MAFTIRILVRFCSARRRTEDGALFGCLAYGSPKPVENHTESQLPLAFSGRFTAAWLPSVVLALFPYRLFSSHVARLARSADEGQFASYSTNQSSKWSHTSRNQVRSLLLSSIKVFFENLSACQGERTHTSRFGRVEMVIPGKPLPNLFYLFAYLLIARFIVS